MTVVVFFDIAGTLIHVRDGVGAQYARVAARFGVNAEPAVLEREFPRAFRSAPRMAFPGASAESIPRLERQVWLGIVREVFAGSGLLTAFAPGAFEAYFEAVYRHFESAEVWQVFPDVMPSLSALQRARLFPRRRQQLRQSRRSRILERLNLAQWFASITLSSQVGATKPDPRSSTGPSRDTGRGRPDASRRRLACRGLRGRACRGLRAVLIDRTGRHPDRPGLVRVESLIALAEIVRTSGEHVSGSDPT